MSLDLLTSRFKAAVCGACDSARWEIVAGSARWCSGLSGLMHASTVSCRLVRAGWSRMPPSGFSAPWVVSTQPASRDLFPRWLGGYPTKRRSCEASWGLGSALA